MNYHIKYQTIKDDRFWMVIAVSLGPHPKFNDYNNYEIYTVWGKLNGKISLSLIDRLELWTFIEIISYIGGVYWKRYFEKLRKGYRDLDIDILNDLEPNLLKRIEKKVLLIMLKSKNQ
jgi:hypothetical protein